MNIVDSVESELSNGQSVYVTIQFGHNDQKIGNASIMATNLETMGNQLLELGAIPIFVTPLSKRDFIDDSTLNDTLQSYADAAISVADNLGQHSIDLHRNSMKYLEDIGEDAAHRLNKFPHDTTRKFHLYPMRKILVLNNQPIDLNVNGGILFGRHVTAQAVSE
jgi:lysophospholipase L1-like esterase